MDGLFVVIAVWMKDYGNPTVLCNVDENSGSANVDHINTVKGYGVRFQ